MTTNLITRNLIKSRLEQNYDFCQIYIMLRNNNLKTSLYRWISHRLISRVSEKNSAGRLRFAWSKLIIAKIKRHVLSSQKSKLVQRIARIFEISTRAIFRIIKNDQALKAYKMVKVLALASAHIGKWKSIFDWIRNYNKNLTCRINLFSHGKWFYQDDLFNRQNDHVYAPSRLGVNKSGRLHKEKKNPFQVMVWDGLYFYETNRPIVFPNKSCFNIDFLI